MLASLKAENIKLEIEGVEFDYIKFGSGSTPLIMLQGLNTRGIKGSAKPLAYMYRCFSKEFTVYLFDRRPVINEEITVRELAADVAKAMDALNLSKAAVLGVSEGGMIAQYLAIERPELVRKLVLAVTLSRNNETVINVINNWIKLAEQGNMRALVEDMAYKMYSERYLKRYKPFIPLLTLLQKPKDVKRFVLLARSCLTCSTYDELYKIKCPTLVIGGKRDLVTTGVASEELARKLNCELHIYENLGHAAYEEAKDFNRRVYDFLKE